MFLPPSLIALVRQHTTLVPTPAMQALREHILANHGDAVDAVIYYGSCLHRGQELEGLVDLYVLVDSYRHFYPGAIPALLNRLLPPNVFYMECSFQDQTLRVKYAVVSLAEFERGTSTRWYHSYLWARFAQPVAVLHARDERAMERVTECLARAVVTFAGRVIPYLPTHFTARDLWIEGLRLSYRAELRPEKPHRAVALYETSAGYLDQLTREAVAALPHPVEVTAEMNIYHSRIPSRKRQLNRLAWTLRQLQGKLLSVLRLLKAVFTFQGGFNYILWKIERHSGVSVDVSPFARRYPLLAGWGVIWRLYRRGAFR